VELLFSQSLLVDARHYSVKYMPMVTTCKIQRNKKQRQTKTTMDRQYRPKCGDCGHNIN